MDGAKLVTDIANIIIMISVVGRRFIWAEAFSREKVDQIKLRILAVVGSV